MTVPFFYYGGFEKILRRLIKFRLFYIIRSIFVLNTF